MCRLILKSYVTVGHVDVSHIAAGTAGLLSFGLIHLARPTLGTSCTNLLAEI